MSKVRVAAFGVSLDGYGAEPDQSLENPLGRGGSKCRRGCSRRGRARAPCSGGRHNGADDGFAARSFENVGAWVLGRNMFAPGRGPWPDDGRKGWWGDEPPYHVPTFILTHYARDPIETAGGTSFHFVTGGIHEALDRARNAARGNDVRIGGGASTIPQYPAARLVDELALVVSRVLLGRGGRSSPVSTSRPWDTNARTGRRRHARCTSWCGGGGRGEAPSRARTRSPRARPSSAAAFGDVKRRSVMT